LRYVNLIRSIENWWVFFLYKFRLQTEDQLLLQSRNGVVIPIPLRLLHTFKEIFLETCYVHGLNKLYQIPKNPVILDIGANAGYFTLFAAARFSNPRIFAYEPIPFNYQQLERNTSLNKQIDIKSFQRAVAAEPGQATMIVEGSQCYSTTAHIARETPPGLNNDQLIEVACTTLADILKDNQLERCDFLKLDCEGAEYEILLKCADDCLSRISVMAIEIHGNMDEIKIFLETQGFQTFVTRKAFSMLWAYRKN